MAAAGKKTQPMRTVEHASTNLFSFLFSSFFAFLVHTSRSPDQLYSATHRQQIPVPHRQSALMLRWLLQPSDQWQCLSHLQLQTTVNLR